jgi:hypothetical protein
MQIRVLNSADLILEDNLVVIPLGVGVGARVPVAAQPEGLQDTAELSPHVGLLGSRLEDKINEPVKLETIRYRFPKSLIYAYR